MAKYVIINRNRFGLDSKYINFLEKVYRYTEEKIWFGLRTKELMTRVNLFRNLTQDSTDFFQSLVNLNLDDCLSGKCSVKEDNYVPTKVLEEKSMCGRTFYRLTTLNYWIDKDDLIELNPDQVIEKYGKVMSILTKGFIKEGLTFNMFSKLIEKSFMEFMSVNPYHYRLNIWSHIQEVFNLSKPHFIHVDVMKIHNYDPDKNHLELRLYVERPGILIGKAGFDYDLLKTHLISQLKSHLDFFNAEFHIVIKEYHPLQFISKYDGEKVFEESYLIL